MLPFAGLHPKPTGQPGCAVLVDAVDTHRQTPGDDPFVDLHCLSVDGVSWNTFTRDSSDSDPVPHFQLARLH